MPSRDEKQAKLTKAIEDFLRAVDRSPGTYKELIDTPVRTATMWLSDLLDGYETDPEEILSGGSPLETESDMVIVRDIFFNSVCPHHLVPYHGVAHVAYIPDGQIVGFSKIGRLIDCLSHRLTIQEEIGKYVTEAMVKHLGAKGAACMLDAEQLCMIIRGVRKPGSRAVTTSYAGNMNSDHNLRKEFLAAIKVSNT